MGAGPADYCHSPGNECVGPRSAGSGLSSGALPPQRQPEFSGSAFRAKTL